MRFLEKIKKKLMGSNNQGPPQECADGQNCENDVMEKIDGTIIDAAERIEKMLDELRR